MEQKVKLRDSGVYAIVWVLIFGLMFICGHLENITKAIDKNTDALLTQDK